MRAVGVEKGFVKLGLLREVYARARGWWDPCAIANGLFNEGAVPPPKDEGADDDGSGHAEQQDECGEKGVDYRAVSL